MSYFSWRPYVSVAQRQANAKRQLAKLKKTATPISPVVLEGRTITRTFWGTGWCKNLEAYSDFSNRLPRGRAYVRNGSVVDLQISRGKISARVAGSHLYKIEIAVKPLAPKTWESIQTDCSGKIDSLIELLQGRLSSAVMEIVTRPERGLFPTPREINLECSCPDWADMCKHVAAVLYGIGARLDQKPELLFLLRGVEAGDLISRASAATALRPTAPANGAPALSDSELADVFGIELAPTSSSHIPPEVEPSPSVAVRPQIKKVRARSKTKSSPPRPKEAPRRLSTSVRARLAALTRARWAKIKASTNPKLVRRSRSVAQ